MLLTKEVEVTLCASNVKYYENLGYVIPRNRDKQNRIRVIKENKLLVNIEDVPKGSGVLVDVEYDCCHKHRKMRYLTYNKQLHDGKIYCSRCANRILNSGDNNNRWNPNKTDEEREIGRSYKEYSYFVQRVLVRDDYTCQCCNKKIDGDAEVHHLDGYDWCKERRIDDTNGICLCANCHKNFHLIYGYGNNTKEQYEEWIGHAVDNLEKYNGELPTQKKIYCFENDTIYNNADECSTHLEVPVPNIYQCCAHTVYTNNGYHFLYANEFNKMTKDDIFNYILNHHSKKVVCITTNEIFDMAKLAKEKYGATSITSCCKGKFNYSGELPDGTPLEWMYYDEYILYQRYGVDPLVEFAKKRKGKSNAKRVICTTTGVIYRSTTEAGKIYSVDRHAISDVCKELKYSIGKLADGTKLKWMYYEDFLKLPQEKQNKILSRNKDSSNGESFNMQKIN